MSSVPDPPTVELPLEILGLIVAECARHRATLKQIRLCCKWLSREAAQYLFASICFRMRTEDMERVVNIANSTDTGIASAVKTLELRQTPRLDRFTFREFVLEYGSVSNKSTWLKYYELGLEDPSGEGREDPGLVEFIRQRQELFRDYETQRLEPTLYDMLHEPEHSRVSRLDLSQLAPGNPRRFQQACVDFEDALLTLPNVQRLSVFLSTDFRWHGHCFFESDDSVRVEERAAPLAFVLRALGERSVYSNSVVSIDLKHCEPQWGLQDLDRAWWPRDTARPIEIPAPLITSLSRALMEDAFIHLTELRLESYINDDTFEALGRLVEKTTKLVRLTVWNNSMRKLYWPADMLNRTNNGAQWPMLEELSLQNFLFTTDTLLRTISPVAPTLKSLEVQRCRLVGAESTWPGCFRQMRLLPLNGLCRLDFQRGSQHAEEPDVADTLSKPPQAWSHRDVNNRLLVLYRTGYHYVGFSSQIYDYILKKTDDMPALRLFNEKSREALDWSRRDIHGRFRSSCDALALE